MTAKSCSFFSFGEFRLDAAERRLFRGEQPVPLAPKTGELLVALLESRGRVVERTELIGQIWPDVESGEASLAVAISALRKALGDRPDGGPYIETLPRRGYRFAGVLTDFRGGAEGTAARAAGASQGDNSDEMTDAAASAADGRSPVVLRRLASRKIAALTGAALITTVAIAGYFLFRSKQPVGGSPPRRLAILPFRNLKPDVETDFLGPSLAEATTTRIRQVGSLIVRPSAYVDKYRTGDVDPKKVASELQVDTLMTGTFLKEGDSLRVTIQLVDVKRDAIMSKMPIETTWEKLATLQDKVARNIVEHLQLQLSAGEAEQLARPNTDNPLAYEYLLRGNDMYSRNEFLSAVPLLEKSVELDPNFAAAWAHLGRAYNACASFNLRGRDHHLKAQAAYEQALALDSRLVEANIYMANLFTDTNRVEQAVPLLRTVLQSNPNLAEAHWELGYAYRFAGMLAASIQECEKAREIDLKVKIASSAFNSYLYTGQYDKFLSSLPPDESAAFVVFYRGLGNYYLKRNEQAANDFDFAYELDPQLYTRIGKALSYTIRSRKAIAVDMLRDVQREIEHKGVGDAEAIYKIGQVYAVLEEKATALQVLRRSIEGGFFCYEYFKSDPLLNNIRSEPQFASLLELARMRHEKFKQTFF